MTDKSLMSLTVLPAGHGDCFLVKCGEINILVDSGPSSQKIHARVMKALSEALCGQPIHLAVITHYDDDHIGGLEQILRANKIKIDALLFNSPLLITEHIEIQSGAESNVSSAQALCVGGKLSPCNDTAIFAGKRYKFFGKRVTLTMLSPTSDDIVNFGPEILEPIGEEELVGSRGRVTPICGPITHLLGMTDKGKDTDQSKHNALSLAFTLTFEERSILFLGDSWPSRVTPALRALYPAGSQMSIDVVCVSHHGSKNNNTEEMYRCFNSLQYVISTDGDQHPDIETISRIHRAISPAIPEFYFSENTQKLITMFSNTDVRAYIPKNGPYSIPL